MDYEQEREPFAVTDDGKAEWCLKKIREADEELLKMKAWYVSQIEAAEARHDSDVAYFTGLLRAYFDTVPAKETKTLRKYALPSGDLVISKAKQDYACEDPGALLKWCEENEPELIRVKREPAWADVKKRLVKTDAGIIDGKTGLEVDGVVTLDKPEEFKISFRG